MEQLAEAELREHVQGIAEGIRPVRAIFGHSLESTESSQHPVDHGAGDEVRTTNEVGKLHQIGVRDAVEKVIPTGVNFRPLPDNLLDEGVQIRKIGVELA